MIHTSNKTEYHSSVSEKMLLPNKHVQLVSSGFCLIEHIPMISLENGHSTFIAAVHGDMIYHHRDKFPELYGDRSQQWYPNMNVNWKFW